MIDKQEEVPVHAELVQAAQIALVYRATVRTVPGIALILAGLAFLIGQAVAGASAYLWASGVFALYLFRMWVAQQALASRPSATELIRHSRMVTWITAGLGIAAGGGLLWFFPRLPAETQALVTMICVGWASGAVGVSAQYPPYIVPWFIAFGGSLVLSWALFGGSHRWLIASLVVLLIVYLYLTMRDIGAKTSDSIKIRFEREKLLDEKESLLKSLEARKMEVEAASEAKSRFMAAASHDLRQPLTAISLMHAGLMRVTDAAEATQLARKLSRPVHALESILDSLVEISRLDSGAVMPRAAPFHLADLGSEIEEEFLPRSKASGVAFRLEADSVTVVADRHLTERALRNLIDNAFKFTEKGSVIARMECPDPQTLELLVSDTGSGIPPAECQRIFEDYYQVSTISRFPSRGLGLGLAIVQRLVKLQNGEITLESEEGKGSTFRVRLPALNVATRQAESAGMAVPPVAKVENLDVFFVDDNLDIQDAMSLWGTKFGHRVFFASSGEEALELASSLSLRPDVIVADFALPGIDGLDVIAALKRNWSDVPAVLLTGEASQAVVDRAAEANVPLWRKPVDANRLETEILALIAT